MPLSPRLGRHAEALASVTHRRSLVVLVLALVCGGAGVWGISRLRIDQDFKALLPPETPSVVRLEQLRQRIGTQYNLIVAIESPSRAANIAFGQVLAERLRGFAELRNVVFKREIDFFRHHALLYLPLADLLDLRQRVIERIERETAKQSGFFVELDEEPKEKQQPLPEVDPAKLFARYLGGAEVPGEYMETDEGRLVVVKANPVEPDTNVAFSTRLVARIRATIAALGPARFHPQLRADVQGKYLDKSGEVSGVRDDISRTAIFAVSALVLVIVLYFRTLRSVPIVLIPVVIGTVATLGLAALFYDALNLITTFIFAILLGLGIDFGIHVLSRYAFERQRGESAEGALRISLRSTGVALLAGAATTVAVFLLLQLGRFRGFSQFGAVAGLGVALSLLAGLTVVPAAIAAWERLWPQRWRRGGAPAPDVTPSSADAAVASEPPGVTPSSAGGAVANEPPAALATHRRRLAWAVVVISLGLAIVAVTQLGEIAFEYDFGKLGPKPRPEDKAAQKGPDYRDAVGRVSTWGRAVALCDTSAQCEQITRLMAAVMRVKDRAAYARLRWSDEAAAPPQDRPGGDDQASDDEVEALAARLRRQLAGSKLMPEQRRQLRALGRRRLDEMRHYLQAYLSLHTFVPARQPIKLELIGDLRRRLERKRRFLSAETRDKLDRYLGVRQAVTAERLPAWVREQFRETDGGSGRFVILWNSGSKANYLDSKRIYQSFFDLPVAGAATVPVAASYFVLVEVIDTLRADGPVVIGAAALAVFFCLLLMLRSLRGALLVLLPVLVAIAWLAGAFVLTGWKLNMFNVVTFPLLVGLAVDYSIHIYHRWQEVPRLRLVLREVGGPITLTTLTTFLGFAGLAFANHNGIQSLGLTAGLGLWLTLLGILVTLPAMLVAFAARPRSPGREGFSRTAGPG